MEMLRLRPDQVSVSERLRAIDAGEVQKIAVSMSEIGQITPIEVGPASPDGLYPLIAGAHRLQAIVAAEIPFVLAVLFEGNAEQARLHEIDENLYRRELSPYDQAAFLAERIAILEKLHGKRKAGRPKDNGANLRNYLQETAEQFGLPLRDIQRALKRHRSIDPAVWRALRGTSWIKRGSALDAISHLTPPKQLKVIQALTGGKAKSVAAAIKLVNGDQRPATDHYGCLVVLWERSGRADREAFVEHLHAEGALDALIAGLTADKAAVP